MTGLYEPFAGWLKNAPKFNSTKIETGKSRKGNKTKN